MYEWVLEHLTVCDVTDDVVWYRFQAQVTLDITFRLWRTQDFKSVPSFCDKPTV